MIFKEQTGYFQPVSLLDNFVVFQYLTKLELKYHMATSNALARIVGQCCKAHRVDARYVIAEVRGDVVVTSDAELAKTLRRTLKNKAVSGVRVQVLPLGALRRTPVGIIGVGAAPLRSAPADGAEMVSEVVLGESLRILENSGAWLRVAGPDGYIGWADGPQVLLCGKKDAAQWSPEAPYVVRRVMANIHQSPRPDSPVLQRVSAGSSLVQTGKRSGWIRVRTPMSGDGWLQDVDEFPVGRMPLRRAIVKATEQFLGVPYRWGGTSGFGIDCSGLVQRIFGLYGIQLPRDAGMQATAGISIGLDRQQWKPGDLLFFGQSRVTHVAIYTGRGRVIHAKGYVTRAGMLTGNPLYNRKLAEQILEVRSVIS